MTGATQAQETAQTTTPEGQTQTHATLEDVYKDFGVGVSPQAASGQPATSTTTPTEQRQPPAQVLGDPPDPIQDPERFKLWAAQNREALTTLYSSVVATQGELQKMQRTSAEAAITKDIESAVDIANKVLQLEGNQKQLIEFALEREARADPRFKQVWENRARNPIAWERALTAFAHKHSETFTRPVDPQLREDRKALQASQSQQATTTNKPDEGPAWQKAPAGSAEFQRNWDSMARGHQ